jgi:DNA-binding NarL/FixJ family response regulator
MSVVQVLVVEDSLAWQRFVQTLFEMNIEFKVIHVAIDGLEATQKANELRPDVILMDISLPGMNGIEAARQIRTVSPGSKILFWSTFDQPEIIQAAFEAGGSGYVLKQDSSRDLMLGIKAILHGQRFVSQSLMDGQGGSMAGK